MIRRALIQDAELTYRVGLCPQLDAVTGPVHELLGFAAEDFLSTKVSFLDRIHLQDSDIAEALFSPDGETSSGTRVLRFRHGGGRILCLQVHSKREHKDEGTFLHLKLQNAGSVWVDPFKDDAAYFRTMVENTDGEVFFKDRNHVVIAASPSFSATLEHFLNGRNLVGLTDYDFLPEADADTFYAAEKQALVEGGAPVDLFHEVMRAGKRVSINSRYRPVRGKRDDLLGLFATVHGVTTHLRAEEKVEGAGRISRMGGYTLDLRTGVSTTSAVVDAIFGIDKSYPHDVEGWSSLVHPADRDRMMEYFLSVLDSPGGIFNMEYQVVRHSDGEVRWVHGLGRVDRATDGTPLMMRGTIGDITERKEAEAALRKSQERLQVLIENAPVGLAMFDLERERGVPGGIYISCSACEFFEKL